MLKELADEAAPRRVEDAEQETVCTNILHKDAPVQTTVRNGRIIRIRPLPVDPEEWKMWKITIGDRVFEPPPKVALTSPAAMWDIAARGLVYSPLRIRYPMKRVDFDPKGERHPENRGKSGFVRISWDEALELVADEITRVADTYGPSGIFWMYPSHWQHGAELHSPHYVTEPRLLCAAVGGCTGETPSPDSWEGWYYGGSLVWGHLGGKGHGMGTGPRAGFEEVMKHSKLIVSWANDPESQWWGPIFLRWVDELIAEKGIQWIFITPDCNWGAGLHATKWIPIRPGTDAALAIAIAYVWITEGTYDTEYVATHTYGFDHYKAYVLGEEDDVPKTPQWAEAITGIPSRIIKALAREWSSKPTAVNTMFGAACRTRYAHEWTRTLILLQAMQGLGKPGVTFSNISMPPPNPNARGTHITEMAGPLNTVAKKWYHSKVPQRIWRQFFADAVLNPPIKWYGLGLEGIRYGLPEWVKTQHNVTDTYAAHLFTEYTYPLPGYSEIHLVFKYGTNQIATWCNTNKWIKAYQSPKLEFIVTVDYWWGGGAPFADVILPATTCFERNDISGWFNRQIIVYNKKAIEPIGEAKSDLEILNALAEKLGVLEEYSEGNSEEDWIKKLFNETSLPEYISYDAWKQKGYFIIPYPEKLKASQNPFRKFYENPEKHPLDTPSGKLEFYSQWIAQHFPGDPERPEVPHYIQPWETEEREKYSLLMDSPHPRFRFHTQYGDTVTWLKEIDAGFKIHGPDDYYYEAVWIHPKDAAKRGIEYGDIVKVYNDRGATLAGAYVTERVMPGVVRMPEGARYDPIEVGGTDRGGAVNLLTSDKPLSQHASGMAPNAYPMEIEKADTESI
jgi:trimethylamine-N-oxide reductase (cytochrome c)